MPWPNQLESLEVGLGHRFLKVASDSFMQPVSRFTDSVVDSFRGHCLIDESKG